MTPKSTSANEKVAEIIRSWLDGNRADAIAALTNNPDIKTEKAAVLDLAFAEFVLREEAGEEVDVEAFCGQFPDYHASLGRMLVQQSIQEPSAIPSDAAVPDDLANRTVNVDIVPHEIPSSNPPAKSGSNTPSSGGSNKTIESSSRTSGSGHWPEPGSRIGDFSLVRQMGKGSFGRVFLALEEPVSRHVVIKLSRQKCDEAKVLGRLGHKNVVSVLSAPHDLHSGLYIIVMPYLGSATLEDLLEVAYPMSKAKLSVPTSAEIILTAARRNVNPLDPMVEIIPDSFLKRANYVDGVVWMGIRLSEALSAVHESGFLHHDLKPSNVLLGLDGQPRLLDFNLASDVKSIRSRLGGTLPYMPPEHLNAIQHPESDAKMDRRGDIFSLGVILYELLTGVHPFGRFPKSRSVRAVASEMLNRQRSGFKPIRESNPQIPYRLGRIIEQCLAFEPDKRPESALDVAQEMKRCFSPKTRASGFFSSQIGRGAVTATGIGIISGLAWMASASTKGNQIVYIKDVEDHREVGKALASQGKHEEAVYHLNRACEKEPTDATLWLTLGQERLANGDFFHARQDLKKAAELRPEHGVTHASLGWCLARMGYYDESKAAIEQAKQVGYSTPATETLNAFSSLQLKQDEEAQRLLSNVLQQNPDYKTAVANQVYVALRQSISTSTMPDQATLTRVDRLVEESSDVSFLYFVARYYCWAATKPANAKGDWPASQEMKLKSLTALKKSVEGGLNSSFWRNDSFITYQLGKPEDFSKGWNIPSAKFINPSEIVWRMANPLKEFSID
jgi:serine/threonine protein kinase